MPTRKELELYGDLVYSHRPGIRVLLIAILQEKLFNMKRRKESFYKDEAAFVPKEDFLNGLPLKYMAIVTDQKVVELIRINEQTANQMLAKRTKFVEFDPMTTIVKKGMKYVDKKFVMDNEPEDDKDTTVEK